jgi:hypothetical protein
MENRMSRDALVEALFAFLLAVLFGYALFAGRFWPFKAALFPTVVGIPGVVLALAVGALALRRGRSSRAGAPPQSGAPGDLFLDESSLTGDALKRTAVIFGWIFGAVIGSWLLGQKLALPLFVFGYLKLGSREGWVLSIVMTLATVALLLGVFDYVVNVAWYEGEIFHWLDIEPL